MLTKKYNSLTQTLGIKKPLGFIIDHPEYNKLHITVSGATMTVAYVLTKQNTEMSYSATPNWDINTDLAR